MNASAKPQFAVMGAGSVGCFFGGMLARAGFPVTLIGRQSHVDEVNRQGLWLDAKTFSGRVPMQASTDASGVAGAKVILFCVKSADSGEAARQMAPFLESDAVIICLQNGAENPEIVRGVLPHRVIPAVVYVATEMAGPGHVKHHGRGELVIGDSPVSADIAAWFGQSGVPVEVSANVMGPLWGSLATAFGHLMLLLVELRPVDLALVNLVASVLGALLAALAFESLHGRRLHHFSLMDLFKVALLYTFFNASCLPGSSMPNRSKILSGSAFPFLPGTSMFRLLSAACKVSISALSWATRAGSVSTCKSL